MTRETQPTVLVVDDDADMRFIVEKSLASHGIRTVLLPNGVGFEAAIAREHPDLVILDIEMGESNGLELLLGLRKSSNLPVILLTSRNAEIDRIGGLEIGADDYVTKPFSPRELASRVRAVLRRTTQMAPPADPEPLRFGQLQIDPVARSVEAAGVPVSLTRIEFDLLYFLATHAGEVMSKEELLRSVWGSDAEWQGAETVTEHVRRVRAKVESKLDVRHLHTLRGVGYRFDP